MVLVDSVYFVFTRMPGSVSVVPSRETIHKTDICCRIYPSLVAFLLFLLFVFLFDVLSVAVFVVRDRFVNKKREKANLC